MQKKTKTVQHAYNALKSPALKDFIRNVFGCQKAAELRVLDVCQQSFLHISSRTTI